MPILFALAAGVVVAVSYLVPLIIACVLGGAAIVATFFTTRYYYKNEEANNEEANELKKQQIQRDNALHDEVSKITLQAGIDLQTLLKLSHEQRLELKKAIIDFTKNIEDSDLAATNLTKVSDSIQSSVAETSLITQDLAKELDIMKSELMIVNDKLRLTEENLAQKEQELHEVITKLTYTCKDIAELDNPTDLEAQIDSLYATDTKDNTLFESSAFLSSTAKETDEEISIQPLCNSELTEASANRISMELLYLREKNIGLSHTIDKLKTSIAHLQSKLQVTTANEKLQLEEIQKLIAENRKLTTTIEKLVCAIEEREKYETMPHHEKKTSLRLFQS